jgi:hypothetical protein
MMKLMKKLMLGKAGASTLMAKLWLNLQDVEK